MSVSLSLSPNVDLMTTSSGFAPALITVTSKQSSIRNKLSVPQDMTGRLTYLTLATLNISRTLITCNRFARSLCAVKKLDLHKSLH